MRPFRYLTLITAAFTTVLIVSNIVSTKITSIGWLTFDGGTLLFPLSYIFGDILTEVYGYGRSRRVIWTGFGMMLVSGLVIMAVGALPAASDWPNQSAYDAILGLTPRIILASLVAYAVGEFANSYILAKMKVRMNGRRLWARTISSTLAGEGLDTALFVLIAFAGIFPNELLWTILWSNYVFKVGVEVVLTPVTYRVVGFLKRKEAEDFYDRDTDFNPFAVV